MDDFVLAFELETVMRPVANWMMRPLALVGLWLVMATAALAVDIAAFEGTYTGSAEIEGNEGAMVTRDMSVTISEQRKGFRVEWSTGTTRADGTVKLKEYAIDFTPSERDDVYAAAMQRNVFGKEVPLDPMKGEPYVWARILGETLTVYSLFVTSEGGYEIQQFDRTLSEGGLQLEFQNVRNGEIARRVSTFLAAE
ncbi:MAG: hypothetical protein AB8B60_17925 [Sulfitobacter sp.]